MPLLDGGLLGTSSTWRIYWVILYCKMAKHLTIQKAVALLVEGFVGQLLHQTTRNLTVPERGAGAEDIQGGALHAQPGVRPRRRVCGLRVR